MEGAQGWRTGGCVEEHQPQLNKLPALPETTQEGDGARQSTSLPTARPLPDGVPDHGIRYSLARRAQCLTLLTLGVPSKHIQHYCGIPPRQQKNIWHKAISRGFDPAVCPYVLESYLVDGKRTGRPRKKANGEEEESLGAVSGGGNMEETGEIT